MNDMDAVKTEAEIAKLMAETVKLNAEAAKMNRERFWYPVLMAASLLAAGATLAKIFH